MTHSVGSGLYGIIVGNFIWEICYVFLMVQGGDSRVDSFAPLVVDLFRQIGVFPIVANFFRGATGIISVVDLGFVHGFLYF